MKATINEEGIMEVKALVMSRNLFKQLRDVRQKELEGIIAEEMKNITNEDYALLTHILGYVNEPDGPTWLIAQNGETMIRIRESEYFWILRPSLPGETMKDINKAFQDKVHEYQQIFIK